VPNISDRCFVLTCIHSYMPPRLQSQRVELLENILAIWKTLPSVDEKLMRLQSIFEDCRVILEVDSGRL